MHSTIYLARRAVAFVALVVSLLTVPLVACVGAVTEEPRTLVVSSTGSDSNDGSSSAPWRTLARALPALRPGDTLLVRGGVYRERLRGLTITPGSAGAPIVVRAWPNERPVIEGLLWLRNASYWTVDGINVTWSDANSNTEHMVKFTDGVGWSYSNAEVWGARSFAGVLVYGTPDAWRLSNLHVHDTVPSNDTNQDHLIYVNTTGGRGTIERCLLNGSPNGRAVKVGGADPGGAPVGSVVIRYNTMYDNTGPSNVQFAWTSTGNVVERNIMVKPKQGRAAVTTFELTGTGNVVRNNLSWQAAAVVETGSSGVHDEGGNVLADPGFVDAAGGDFRTKNAVAAAFGRYASSTVASITPSATSAGSPAPTSVQSVTTKTAAAPARQGYRLVAADGGVFSFGDAAFFGSTGSMRLNQPVVGMASTRDGNGYWMVASDGGIFTFGSAAFFGSTGSVRLNQPIVGMSVTPTGRGYWLVASDGGVFTFGDAPFRGSTGNIRLNAPIVAMEPAPDGNGYWLVASDGGVFSFGSATFHGSAAAAGGKVVGMASTSTGSGYWLLGESGAVHAFGDARHFGSVSSPVAAAGIARTAGGDGYWVSSRGGAVYAFGGAASLGSVGGALNSPVVGMSPLT